MKACKRNFDAFNDFENHFNDFENAIYFIITLFPQKLGSKKFRTACT